MKWKLASTVYNQCCASGSSSFREAGSKSASQRFCRVCRSVLQIRIILIRIRTVFRIRIHLIRIRIDHFGLNSDPDPSYWWQKIGKYLQNCNLLIPRSPLRTSKLQKKPWALKENIKHLRIRLPDWIWIRIRNTRSSTDCPTWQYTDLADSSPVRIGM